MTRYSHSWDLGDYELFKDNFDGTALFLKMREPGEPFSCVLPEVRAELYPWSEIREIVTRRCECERCRAALRGER